MFLVGFVAALGDGVVWPIWGVLFSSALGKFSSVSGVAHNIESIAVDFVYLGIGCAVATLLKTWVFETQSKVRRC